MDRLAADLPPSAALPDQPIDADARYSLRSARTGSIIAARRKANPGFAILAHGKQVTASVTGSIDKPIDAKTLHQDVAGMLDAKAFLGWAGKKASCKLHKEAGATRTAAESGEVDFQDLMEAEPVEGPVHHIELTIQKNAPSSRSKQLIEPLRPKSR